MQMEKARALRKTWGDKPCKHLELEKEYNLGSATGDYVCKKCGKADWGSDWAKKEREGIKKKMGD